MKNLLKFTLLIIVSSFTFFSCNNDESVEKKDNIANIELLKKDARFSDLIKSNINLMNNVVDFNKAKSLTQKSSLSTSEISELSIALGFKNSEEYQSYINNQKSVLRNLNNEYNLESVEKSKLINLGIEAIKLENSNLYSKSSDDCNCERIRRNCIVEVGAAAVVGHLGCASVDWTGIGAPICHGAVLIAQIAASDNCNANAENCLNNCK